MAKTPELDLRDNPLQNHVINSNFDFWQRGTSINLTSSDVYTSDRWRSIYFTGTSGTFSRQSTGVPLGSTYCLRMATTSASTRYGMHQFFESALVNRLKGKTCTLTFKVRRNSSIANPCQVIVQKNTSADTTAGVWNAIASDTIAIALLPTGTSSTDWYTYSIRFAVPNDGTANGLRIQMGMSAAEASGAYLEFAQVQVNEGENASPYCLSGWSHAGELLNCQRYYEKSYILDTTPGTTTGTDAANGIASSSGELDLSWDYRTYKRAGATVTIYSPVTGATSRADSGGDKVVSVSGAFSWGFYLNSGGVVSASSNYSFHWTADAEIS